MYLREGLSRCWEAGPQSRPNVDIIVDGAAGGLVAGAFVEALAVELVGVLVRGSHSGLPHDQVAVGVSGREGHGGVHDGLVLDGRQSAQAGLSTTPVIGPLDPSDHRDA